MVSTPSDTETALAGLARSAGGSTVPSKLSCSMTDPPSVNSTASVNAAPTGCRGLGRVGTSPGAAETLQAVSVHVRRQPQFRKEACIAHHELLVPIDRTKLLQHTDSRTARHVSGRSWCFVANAVAVP